MKLDGLIKKSLSNLPDSTLTVCSALRRSVMRTSKHAGVRIHYTSHAQTTKTYYKHQDSRSWKAARIKDKDFAQTLIYKIFPSKISSLSEDCIAAFKISKYEHVGQDTRSQGGKDDQDKQG
ncbi:hypothetical protein Tco_0322283 [Tanacetum coccineum]